MMDNNFQQIDWTGFYDDDMVEKFKDFHEANPQVYERLVNMTRNLVARGRPRIGMGMLFEVIRWEHYMKTEGEPFKLNNNYRAFYSRLIEKENPDLKGIFTKRQSVSDEEV